MLTIRIVFAALFLVGFARSVLFMLLLVACFNLFGLRDFLFISQIGCVTAFSVKLHCSFHVAQISLLLTE